MYVYFGLFESTSQVYFVKLLVVKLTIWLTVVLPAGIYLCLESVAITANVSSIFNLMLVLDL